MVDYDKLHKLHRKNIAEFLTIFCDGDYSYSKRSRCHSFHLGGYRYELTKENTKQYSLVSDEFYGVTGTVYELLMIIVSRGAFMPFETMAELLELLPMRFDYDKTLDAASGLVRVVGEDITRTAYDIHFQRGAMHTHYVVHPNDDSLYRSSLLLRPENGGIISLAQKADNRQVIRFFLGLHML